MESFDNFLLVLFRGYSKLLKKEFSRSSKEIVTNDDYMPMPINSLEEYDNVINVCWFKREHNRE
jgi:hypothetical protein